MKSVPVPVLTKSGCITVPEGSAKLSIQEGCYRTDLGQGQVGYSLLQSGILPLQLLQTPCPADLQRPIFLSSPVIGLVSNPEPPTDLFHGTALRQQDLRLPKPPDDLLNTVLLAFHPDLPLRPSY